MQLKKKPTDMKKITLYTLIHLFTASLFAASISAELYTEASAAGLANESNSKGSWNNNYYLSVETSDVATGSYALRINRSGSYSVSTYSFSTTPGEVYTLTGKIKVNTLNQQFISMIGFTNVQTDQGRTPTTGWATFTYTAQAQGSSASIRIGASNGGGNSGDYLLLDALSIKQGVPDTPIPIIEDNTPYQAPSWSDQNYVVKRTYQDSVSSIQEVAYRRQVAEEVQYFDGLGRPIQQLAVQQSPDHQDMITPVIYDNYGRQTKTYLPYPSQQNNPSHGSYRNNAIDSTHAYYLSAYSTDLNSSAPNPFSESLLENSPLNRVQKQAAPGEAWKMGNGHEIEFNYQNNASGEVRLFKVVFSGNNTEAPTLSGSGSTYYQPQTLTKTVTKDENHDGSSTKLHTTEEFKDKQGRVILKRTYAILNGTVEAHDTYYVYDDFGNLTYVLPPKVDTSNGVSSTELSELCYQYKYDHRNRLVEKKIPGKAVEYIVYNQLDQPIFTQDAKLRQQNKWLYTKYDAFGRVVQTGFYTFTGSRQAVITAMENYYNSGTYKLYEQKSGNSYTNQSYPIANTELLTENYYDTYNFDLSGFTLPPNTITNVQGLAVGSKVKVLTTSHWITTLMGYDAKGRVIWTGSYNSYLDTRDEAQTQYDFPGKVLQTTTTHTKGSNAPIAVTERFTYDHAGRLTRHTHQIGNGPEELLAQNTYDETGQLVRKNVGNTLSSPLQQVDYQYNIRGWLKEINDVNSPGSDLFSFKIGYNEGANALYNGNISSTRWRTNNTDNSLKSYDYSYDALNRITDATDNLDRYSLKDVSYDKNGNILRLTRKGAIVDNPMAANSSHFGTMDILTYHYDGSSNRLRKVTDAAPIDKYGFKDDAVNTSADPTNDYYYDSNGNMLSDTNKGIGVSAHIAYNHLNLPTQVSLPNGTISYIYDAVGMKLKKIVDNTAESSLTTTEYAGNYVYEDGNLQFFNSAEGYVEEENGVYSYIYQYKDHLGNIRLSYQDANGNGAIAQSEIREENNYYPFGLQHKGYNNVVNGTEHPYKYNGKEHNQELGLNWYDYGARNYQPDLGRWMNLDHLAKDYDNLSPFVYAANNPVFYIDPDGQRIAIYGNEDYRNKVLFQLALLAASSDTGNDLVMNAINSKRTLVFADVEGVLGDNTFDGVGGSNYNVVGYDANGEGYLDEDNGRNGEKLYKNSSTTLAHELGHFESITKGNKRGLLLDDKGRASYDRSDEVYAVERENSVRKELGLDERTHYGGRNIYGKKAADTEYPGYFKLVTKKDYAIQSQNQEAHNQNAGSTSRQIYYSAKTTNYREGYSYFGSILSTRTKKPAPRKQLILDAVKN
jgi:RHS repeat-associated protein